MAEGGGRIAGVPRRRARITLAVAGVLVALLGILGIGVEGKLQPSSLRVPGTDSARGADLLRAHFGDSAPFVILLRGPAAALDRQGPRLVRELRSRPHVTTLSPWDKEQLGRLRPAPGKALILVDFHVDAETAVKDTVGQLERALEHLVQPPVRATQTGFATLSRAIQDESVHSTRIAELVALPILLLVLLLVFRSPVAAAIPLLFGAATVLAARGVLSLAASRFEIDGFSLTVTSMMGLALGVDYALLMVSRFREELAGGTAPLQASERTRRTAGATTAFAGSTLILAMAVTLWVMPGNLFLSLAGTAILVTVISVAIASFVAPPLLFLLGANVNRWQLGAVDGGQRLMELVGTALARPRLAAVLIGGALLLLALPVLGLKTGPPSADQLPRDNGAREDAEAIDTAIGAGWDAPYLLVAATDDGPITTRAHLAALRRVQRQIAADPAVQAVVGPGQVERRVAPLRKRGNELLAEEGSASPKRVARLGRRLERAAGGVERVRRGLSEAAAGAGLLATGSGRARDGAGALASGLGKVEARSETAVRALEKLDRGSGRLASGHGKVTLGARALSGELNSLVPQLKQGALVEARRLRNQLQRAAASEPALEGAAREAKVLVRTLAAAKRQAVRSHNLSLNVRKGEERLKAGSEELHGGAGELAQQSQALPSALGRLGSGAEELEGGLEQLTGGADALSSHLSGGYQRSRPLQTGLTRASVKVTASGKRLSRQVQALRRSSPRIFDSGSFVLSALEGAPAGARERAGQVVDLRHGGQAAQVLVIPRYTFNTDGSRALNGRLDQIGHDLGLDAGLRTGVTGGPAQLDDYSDAISSRVPWVVAAITVATFLVLVLILGALPLAAIAVVLNLLTVAVAFGVLTLLFDVPAGWPLGGHSYVDAIGAAGIFGIVFGLSIDYAVFLLSRMRERHAAGASNAEAIDFGLQRTARVITGAAAIMVAVFISFAAAPIATVSQLGTGLTVAVLLDATVVRIVLLPALMLWMGERVWWMPAAIARRLPRIGVRTT